ncbi:MAG: hypothetical protein WAO71_12445 [Gallionella sp.]
MWYKLLTLAIALESGSWFVLLQRSSSMEVMVTYFTLHTLGSIILAIAIRWLIPKTYRHPRGWLLLFLFSYNFFMPVVGLLGALLGFLLGVWLPRHYRLPLFVNKHIPRYTTHRNREGTGFRSGRVRSQLNNAETPLDHRLNALMAVEETPARVTGNMLRKLLSDSSDDIRLLAYGILDGKEKQIAQRIQASIHTLAELSDADQQYQAHKRIAELYFELIYQDLVQGDMRLFSATQVREHIQLAQQYRAEQDAGLWFMLARLELSQGNADAADHALQHANTEKFTYERLLPYLAELRFLQRRFADIRALFADARNAHYLPALMPLRDYWMNHETTPATPENTISPETDRHADEPVTG